MLDTDLGPDKTAVNKKSMPSWGLYSNGIRETLSNERVSIHSKC